MVSQTTRLESARIVGGHQDYILAAMIHTQKCLPYLEQMINNYLQEARTRFDKDKQMKSLQNSERRHRDMTHDEVDQAAPVDTCQCRDCHQRSSALYGSGNSKFYVTSDDQSHQTLRHLPVMSPVSRSGDHSLYLARSTFFRDHNPRDNSTSGTVVPVPRNLPDPMPIVPVDPPDSNIPPKPPIRNLRKKSATAAANNKNNHDEVFTKHRVDNELRYRIELPGITDSASVMCRTKGCSFFGSFETNFYCSQCYRDSQQPVIHSSAATARV